MSRALVIVRLCVVAVCCDAEAGPAGLQQGNL